jgi:hypothetical protein
MIAPESITLNRSERLRITYTPKLDGATVPVDGDWSHEAAISRDAAGARRVAVVPTSVDGSARVSVNYDTVGLTPGTYWFQLRITAPGQDDAYTFRRQLVIHPIIPNPSPR